MAQIVRGPVRQTAVSKRARNAPIGGRERAGCYGHATKYIPETPHEEPSHAPRRAAAGRRARRRGASPSVLSGSAMAQADDLAPYRAAKINWKQAEGETITVAVIPASYFDNLISLQPQFEALTGIKLRFEKVPPGQIRQKAMLDLSSKTATYATHAADPMYYPLYVANKWVEPLDKYLNDATLTDKAWFNYDDIIKAWRDADSIDGKPYGIPYDGEVTVQVYRKDLYDAKGLKPADTYDELRQQRQGAAPTRPTRASTAWRCAASPAPARTCTSTRRSSRLRRRLVQRQRTSSSTRPRR